MPIPYITVKDPAAVIELYERAFGATKIMSMDGPGGSIMHAEISIADERFMLGALIS